MLFSVWKGSPSCLAFPSPDSWILGPRDARGHPIQSLPLIPNGFSSLTQAGYLQKSYPTNVYWDGIIFGKDRQHLYSTAHLQEPFKAGTSKFPEIAPLQQKTGPAHPVLPPLISARHMMKPLILWRFKTLVIAILSPAMVSLLCPLTLINYGVLYH